MKWFLILLMALLWVNYSEAGVIRARSSASCGASGTSARARLVQREGRGTRCGPIRHLLKKC